MITIVSEAVGVTRHHATRLVLRVWSMHMQPLALCEAAMAVCYVCPCTMLHASEVPYRHPGEVTS